MRLRIANWNLDRASVALRHGSVREKLAEIEAQIWVLTETRDAISPGAGYRRIAESIGQRRGDNDERWVSIWTNLPNAAQRHTRDEEYAASAIIELPSAATLAVYGTVLPWRGSAWRGRPSANAIAYEAALTEQALDWSELTSQAGLLCVAGDFNQDLSDTAFYWSDAARVALQGALNASELCATTGDPTDPVRKMTEGREACIDHICISRSLVEKQVGTAQAWLPIINGHALSHHPGVWLELADV